MKRQERKAHRRDQTTADRKTIGPRVSSPVVSPSRGLVVLLGIFFGLCLLKFSNPPVMEKFVEAPKNGYELLAITPWPVPWAYWILGCFTALILAAVLVSASVRVRILGFVANLKSRSSLVLFLPLAWLGWQLLAACFSIRHDLSNPTLLHYSACVLCFYLGLFCLGRIDDLRPFWLGILCGFALVIAIGLDQHFGGLAESRAYFYQQQRLYPDKQLAPELLKKIASNRIYSTLFYPNTLAGALLLFTPAMLLVTLQCADRWRLGNASRSETVAVLVVAFALCAILYVLNTHGGWAFILLLTFSLIFPVPRWAAPLLLTLGILAVLFWSGSKAGWLIMLLMAIVALLRWPNKGASSPHPSPPKEERERPAPSGPQFEPSRSASRAAPRLLLVGFLLLAGLTGFFVRYSTFFRKGATSVSARFDYWRAAVQTAGSHPLLGTGPGTFQVPYAQIKRPEAEMARLVHNDYLQQATDSGIPGFLIYTAFVVGCMILSSPKVEPLSPRPSHFSPRSAIWLGLLGWALQCCVEFSLQVPALAWPAFALMGYLCGCISLQPRQSRAGH